MKKFLPVAVILYLFALFPTPGIAITLSLDPPTQDINVGATAMVDLNISGLGDFTAPSLGAFLVEITFDESVVSFDSVVYEAFLGDTDPLSFETDIVTIVGPGFVSLDEISFLSDLELDVLQPSGFTLATLTFVGASVGTSALAFDFVDLADAGFPSSTIIPESLETASITVERVVPEPGTLLLLLTGVVWFGALRRRGAP